MQITYSSSSVLKSKEDVLLLLVNKDWQKSEAVKIFDKHFNKRFIAAAKQAKFKASKNSQFVFQNFEQKGVDYIMLWGVGDSDELSAEDMWDAAHKAMVKIKSPAIKSVAIAIEFAKQPKPEFMISKLTQGLLSGLYSFTKYKTGKTDKIKIGKIGFYGLGEGVPKPAKAKAAIKRGQYVAEGINLARDLVNEPAETMTPKIFADNARKISKELGLVCKIETEKQIEKKGMTLFLAVARGSKNPPYLITMTHNPKGATGKPIVLVGKGLMYDSGGYSLKPSASMETMKCDMAGSAAVIGAMYTLAKLNVKRKVIAIVAACENMIGQGAYRVGDVFGSMNGKTVEVLNTDAEGRLTLADALTYAQTFKPKLIVDLATLTGACVVALGKETVGLFGDDKSSQIVTEAFERAGEDVWRLPLNKRLKPLIKSNIADIKNVGGRWGGAITAGLFLEEFIDEGQAWVHLDIAGPAFQTAQTGHLPKGGSGVAVASLVELIDPSL